MRPHRLPRKVAEMGDFFLPPLLGRDPEKPKPKPKKLTKRQKEKARAELRRAMKTDRPSPPRRMTCYSATCFDCGKVWLSAIRPIRNNAIRNGANVYVCGNCQPMGL